jgi:excisionase family DNA binding protein
MRKDSRQWLTTDEVARLTGTHYRTVVRWAADGMIEVEGGGHGESWRWSEKNYREAFVLARLRREGFSRQEIRKQMKTLAGIGHNPFSRGRFLVLERPRGRKRGTIVKIMETGEAMELCGKGRVQLLLPFPNAPWSEA